MRYLAILGQNRELSLAELEAVYRGLKNISRQNESVIFDSEEKIDIDRLGGTPKLAEVLAEDIAFQNVKDAILKELNKLDKDKKIFFGMSFYGNSDSKKYDRLGKEIKSALKNAGYKARWAVSRELALSSVYIKTNKLLTRGFDFNIIFAPSVIPAKAGIQVTVAKTVAVQDFADYEFRDMRRPARDLFSGMTPPKLAKIMINLTNLSPLFRGGDARRAEGVSISPHPTSILPSKEREEVKKKTFLDPFCGSGTFLAEAALLGFQNICGSDVSAKAVSDSRKNIEWLIKNYKNKTSPTGRLQPPPPLITKREDENIEIKLCDIKNITKCWTEKFDCIATEPYLGSPIRGELSFVQAEKMQKELSGLYEIYLKNLSSMLEKNGTLVLIVPFFFTDAKNFKINLKIKENSLAAVRPSILYSRPDQKVGREIYVLNKTG